MPVCAKPQFSNRNYVERGTSIVFLLRVVGFLLLTTIGASLVTYLLTRNRRYLTFAWQVLKYGMVMAIIVLTFMLLERLVLVI